MRTNVFVLWISTLRRNQHLQILIQLEDSHGNLLRLMWLLL